MFNNPYMFPQVNQMAPMMRTTANPIGMNTVGRSLTASKPGFFKSLAAIKWGNVLTNTQKTLNVINQAIPVYYQMKPIWGNIKSFGKIMSAFNEPDNNQTNNSSLKEQKNNQINKEEKKDENGLPTFFIN